MIYLLLGAVMALIVYLYATGFQKDTSRKHSSTKQKMNTPPVTPKPAIRFCPLCASIMAPGEKLHVELYKADPHDKVFILGCEACLPAESRETIPEENTTDQDSACLEPEILIPEEEAS